MRGIYNMEKQKIEVEIPIKQIEEYLTTVLKSLSLTISNEQINKILSENEEIKNILKEKIKKAVETLDEPTIKNAIYKKIISSIIEDKKELWGDNY